jgi:hypothetical protein
LKVMKKAGSEARADHRQRAQAESREQLADVGPRQEPAVKEGRQSADGEDGDELSADDRQKVNADGDPDHAARESRCDRLAVAQLPGRQRAAATAERRALRVEVDPRPVVAGLVQRVHGDVNAHETEQRQPGQGPVVPIQVSCSAGAGGNEGDGEQQKRCPGDAGDGGNAHLSSLPAASE